jgi:hypothetical protein
MAVTEYPTASNELQALARFACLECNRRGNLHQVWMRRTIEIEAVVHQVATGHRVFQYERVWEEAN